MSLGSIIICRTDGTVEVMKITTEHEVGWWAEQIGAEYIEIVRARGLKSPYLMICDEEGRLKERPVLNIIGSWLYGAQEHGSAIAGDVIIAKTDHDDIAPMGDGEADVMADWLLENFWKWHDEVMKKIGDSVVRG